MIEQVPNQTRFLALILRKRSTMSQEALTLHWLWLIDFSQQVQLNFSCLSGIFLCQNLLPRVCFSYGYLHKGGCNLSQEYSI
jgi:hypothetical protein